MGKLLCFLIIVSTVCLIVYIYWYMLCSYRQKKLRSLAKTVFEGFNKHNINYWADYGTLLGIVRDKDIIFHDTDVDICVPYTEDFHRKIRQIVDEIGGDIRLDYYPWKHYRIRNDNYWGFYVDIYSIKEKGEFLVDPTGKIPKELVGNPQKIVWQGIPVKVPEKIHESLVYRYGKDYMTPKRFFGNKALSNFLK